MDYLELYKRFKDAKDIADYIDEVEKLRFYYGTHQHFELQAHIKYLTEKYPIETFMWNSVNRYMPTDDTQSYINAENFMRAQGAKLIVEKVLDFRKRLTQEEIVFIESITKPVE